MIIKPGPFKTGFLDVSRVHSPEADAPPEPLSLGGCAARLLLERTKNAGRKWRAATSADRRSTERDGQTRPWALD